jgi:hypothetical protein
MMRDIHVDYPGSDLDYQRASLLALDAARQIQMQMPTIMAWHSQSAMSPGFIGADPDTWWEKYGEGNGGRLEVSVGSNHEYGFVMMDTRGFETLDEIPLRNLSDSSGTQYVCYAPMLGDSATPNPQACSPLDDWLADQY